MIVTYINHKIASEMNENVKSFQRFLIWSATEILVFNLENQIENLKKSNN